MKKTMCEKVEEIRKSRFPVSTFAIVFLLLLAMSGIHEGLIVLFTKINLYGGLSTTFALAYWALVALALSSFIAWRMKVTYEEPMQALAKAAKQVADGDFSVYIPPMHTADQLDYLDQMLLDFDKMVAELGSIETLKTDFFSNVSHEIKTPLAVIQSSAEMLHRGGVTEAQRMEYTETILQMTARLSGLITNMLKLNKLEKQTITPNPARYNLCEQLCSCVFQFEEPLDKKNITFEADLADADVRVEVLADAGLMDLVWTNLFSNALKFTPEGGMITLRESSDGDTITVSVTDTGCGMDEETIKHIFDKFYQGDTSHATEGNGLGLALALRILQLSDGTIVVESTPGKGTTFTATLPAAKKQKGESE